jgi:phage gp46-like protein
MRGLRLVWDPVHSRADLALTPQGLDTSHLLETLIIVLLFTDRRADPSDVLRPGQTDPRGWWGDSPGLGFYPPGFRLGSRLWLLEGAKAVPSLPLTAKGYILEALSPLIEDGIAQSVDANCFFSPLNEHQLDCLVTIKRPGANDNFAFANIWNEEFAA